MKEAGSPKLLFENLDLTPIHPTLWTKLHNDGPGRTVEYARAEAEENELGVEYRSFDQLLEESDILTVHVPLTDETRGMIGEDEIARMKDGAYIINTSRREVLDEPAVLEALKEGKLSGFGTDFMLDDPLTGFENIMMTGHSAGGSIDLMEECWTQHIENIARALRGERPLNIVNDI